MLELKPKQQIICVVLTTVAVASTILISLSLRSSSSSPINNSNDAERSSKLMRNGHNLWNDTPYVHIPNTYCNNYYETGGNDETCMNGNSFHDIWEKCQNDGEKCMGVQWNSCDQSDTSNIGVNGAWKLLSAGQHIGDSENPTEDCGGKEQALGDWDIFVKKSVYYKDLPIHIPNTYCKYYDYGGDGKCEDGIPFDEAWEKCLKAMNSKCMGVMWNSCEGATSNTNVNGAWKLMTAGQSIGDAENPTDTCGGKGQALGHWDVFVRESMFLDPERSLPQTEKDASYVEVTSGTCETHGYEVVDSSDECSAAAIDRGLTITWGPHGGYSDVITGCSVRFRGHLFYNRPGVCDPAHGVGGWTHTGCQCTDWMPCICRIPQDTDPCKSYQTKVEISITTDNYPSEITWSIHRSDGEVVARSDLYLKKYSTDINEVLCLEPLTSCHRFTIMDAYGDGLIKGGGFRVTVDNTEVLSNMDSTPFRSMEVNIGGQCTVPSLHVQSNKSFPQAPQDGKIAILSKKELDFWLGDLGYAQVSDSKDIIFRNTHIKQNQGFIGLAKNLRTKKEGGFMIWTNADVAYGSWNPIEFSKVNDWKDGDEIELVIDEIDEVFLRGFAREDCTYKALTKTGWNLPAESIRFGQSGLVGHWWKELEIEYEFSSQQSIGGVWSDSMILPYSIKYETSDGVWVVLENDCRGTNIFSTPVSAKKWRLYWESTNLFDTRGLSTYRGGGGLHAELLW